MSVFKKFLSRDIIVTPFKVTKNFHFEGASALTGSNVEIDRFLGKNISGSSYDPDLGPVTGQVTSEYQELIYDSIKHLYYSNYISSSVGSGSYENYLSSTLTASRLFPTGGNDIIGVISIPSKLYGEYIQPSSFRFTSDSGSITDDGEGNLIFNNNKYCGNILYKQGIIVINGFYLGGYGSVSYGNSTYGGAELEFSNLDSYITNFITSSNITCSFTSTYTIYETQYKCTIDADEFNLSYNPSLISGSLTGSIYKDIVTGSEFSPYITTIGLYDENQELLMVGKLAQPLPTSQTTDTTILINIDR